MATVDHLLYTELQCAAHRRGFPGGPVNAALGGINLVDVARSDLMYAAALMELDDHGHHIPA